MRSRKLLLFLFAVAFPLWLGLALFLPPSFSGEPVEVDIPAGTSLSGVARQLKGAGAIRSAWVFRAASILTGNGRKMKAGDYEIPRNLGSWAVVELLASGKALQHRFLVPEGMSASQIASMLGKRQLADPARFMRLVRDPHVAESLGVDAPGLEGWLFPDSYQVSKGLPEEAILAMMVSRFHEKVPAGMLERGKNLGLSPLQALTLASLVEKEARADSERPRVARVFLNRRARKMRLESCATVRFVLQKYKGPLLYADLDAVSPYNTYRHAGLPPGPICSPGLESIEAALAPAEGDWLFFVVAGDGTHVFSRTFEEHVRAKLRHKLLQRGVVEEEGD